MRRILVGSLVLIVLIFLVTFSFVIHHYYSIQKEREEIIQECTSAAKESRNCFPRNSTLNICKVYDDGIIPLENLTDINFNCGEKIMYTIRLNLVANLPERFYFCGLYDKLLNTTEFRCGGKTSYVNEGKQVFTCFHTILNNSIELIFFYKGIIPNKTGEINLLELYIYPLTNEKISQDYFWNNINNAKKAYTLHGRVAC